MECGGPAHLASKPALSSESPTHLRDVICPVISLGQDVTVAAAAAAKPLQSCLTLCDPRDGSPPGSPVPGILQARTLEWCRGPAPVDPGNLKRGRRRRGSGNNCLIKR